MAKPIDGSVVRRARADLVRRDDVSGRRLARRLSDQMDGWFDALGAELSLGWSLVATGGYASGLLCPGSDIDVVLLHPEGAHADDVTAAAERLWYPMWDAGLNLSPSAHSIRSLLALAAGDLHTATSLLRLRRLAGDNGMIAVLRDGALDQWRSRGTDWLRELRAVTLERWSRSGDVASLLEPDLKDGQGGLRDCDGIRWALAVDRAAITAAMEAPFEDLAGPAETLLAARCELHRRSGMRGNSLLLEHQDGVAAALGYTNADVLMARVAEAARSIDWISERFWDRVERVLQSRGRGLPAGRSTETLRPGITVVDEEVHVDLGAVEVDQSLILRVAAEAAHAGYPVSRRALVALSGTTAAEDEVWDETTRYAMLSLLGAGDHLISTVEALERYELFSAMLPEWRRVRSLPQRNALHLYTVDRHLLQAVVQAGAFVRDVARPDLLLMGALLHDIGKGSSRDHSEIGVELVDDIGPRMGFAPADVDIIRFLVEHHLLLSDVATRRDLSDPRTAESVAGIVGDSLRLELLRALTEADGRATGPTTWSPWKQSLVDELVHAVRAVFAGQPQAVSDVALDERYGNLLLDVRTSGEVRTLHERDGEFDVWVVAAPDQPGLFAQIAGTLAMHGIDVVSARAWTSPDNIAVDQFRVFSGGRGGAADWARLDADLRSIRAGTLDVVARIDQRIQTYSRVRRRAISATPPRLEVLISNDASDATTLIDVRAPDAIAVLYRLARALSARGLDIRSAKVATLGHEVVDVFYVQSPSDGGARQVPVEDFSALRDELKRSLSN